MKIIELTQGKFALVDDEDYERLNQYKWRAEFKGTTWYVVSGARKNENHWYMHNFLMGTPPKGFFWDHKDRNGCNNQKLNLRLATYAQNRINSRLNKDNTSGFRGVCYNITNKSWQRKITINGIRHVKAGFATAEVAARSYDVLAKQHFGEFAQLNFPNEA